MHSHYDYAELFLIEKGEVEHHVNGEVCNASEKTLILIRPSDRHKFKVPEDGCTMGHVSFQEETLQFLKDRYFQNENRFFWGHSKLPPHVTLHDDSFVHIGNELDKLFSKEHSLLHVERFLLNLLQELTTPKRLACQADEPAWLLHALKQLNEPEILLGGTATFFKVAGRSSEHVARTVRKHRCMTPTELVNQARMTYAATQLKEPDKKIFEIAMECGFESTGHFYSLFRKQHGLTPHQYRLRHGIPPK